MQEVTYGEQLKTPQETAVKRNRTVQRCLLEALLYFVLFFVTLSLFWVAKPLLPVQRKGAVAQTFIALCLLGCGVFVAYMGATKRLKTKHILVLLFIVAYVIRVGYMLYTPAAARQQDTFTKNNDGHEAYAWTIFTTGKLPTTNKYQFYHPPLNALVQAGFMKFMSSLTAGVSSLFGLESYFPTAFNHSIPSYFKDENRYYLYSTCQILSVMYSFITAVVLVKTVWLFGFPEKTKTLLAAFVLLYPRQIQFAGMLNNDGISYLLGVLAMYYALKWQKGNKNWAWIVLCGFAVGLGMMAKLSSATVCLPIAGVFIYEFACTLAKKEGAISLWKMLLQYGVFLLICAPIGLWFQVYAKMRFDQNFGFVFSNLNRKLYTGDHSLFGRFIFTFDFSEWFGSIYCRPFEGNYYLFNYALRSSIFGEFSYWQGEGYAVAAIFTAYLSVILLAISLTWAVVACIKTRKSESSLFRRAGLKIPDLLFVFLLVQSQVLSEIYFYIQMPYGCTMDFRYIMPLILGIALTLGYTRKILVVEGGKFSQIMNNLTLVSVGAFLTVSTLFYSVCI